MNDTSASIDRAKRVSATVGCSLNTSRSSAVKVVQSGGVLGAELLLDEEVDDDEDLIVAVVGGEDVGVTS